MLFIYKIIRK